MTDTPAESASLRPWATKRPQSLVLSAVIVVLGIAVVATAISFIASGRGGIVPVLMLLGGPVVCGAYLVYLNGTRWE